ncbi:hypothetical protein PENTCL1PPCAC_15707, partial [Pristionchus entomophagus]
LTEFGYIYWGCRVLDLPTEQGFWASLIWVVLFYQTFVLTAFHYVYRFVLLCNPPWLSWIQRNPWRNWVVIAVAADLFYVDQIKQEVYEIDLFAPNKPAFLGIVYW